ncbi:hypothetical protein [Steroidobacter cummioxidans]|uniref:hypothetical protein n=1 Tax=Steroidobacter cummioxidans TaxID=1803913 RepID=UPI00129042CA|nr:hypothetical protein [Steroidobacter cummioxidans]
MRTAESVARDWILRVKNVFVLSVAGFSSVAAAGDMTGVIREVHLGPVYGTKVFLKIDGTATTLPPSCQTDTGYKFVFDADSPTGRALLATALAAQVSGQNVKLNGYNECNLFGTVEDLRWLSLGD